MVTTFLKVFYLLDFLAFIEFLNIINYHFYNNYSSYFYYQYTLWNQVSFIAKKRLQTIRCGYFSSEFSKLVIFISG